MTAQPEAPAPHDWLLPHTLDEGGNYACPEDCPAMHGGARPEAPGDGVHLAVPCGRCGGEVNITVGDHRYALRISAPIVHAPNQCVGEAPPEPPPTRRFEARVTVVEITDEGEQVMSTVTAKAEAATFKAAVDDALSGDLQARWLKMCETAHLADMG